MQTLRRKKQRKGKTTMTNILNTLPDNSPLSEEQKAYLATYFTDKADAFTSDNTKSSSCVVLFGSQTGNAESVAYGLGTKLGGATVMDMSDVDMDTFKAMKQVVIITSTYGDGEHPDNGQIMWDACKDIDGLSHMEYAILGLGDTAYDLFCQSASDWDVLLEKAGANRVLDTVKLDVDYEDEAESFGDALVPIFGNTADDSGIPDISILFGTQTGNAQNIADDIATLFNTQAIDMGDVDINTFKAMNNVIIVTSTYGDGEHPDNGQIMWDACKDIDGLSHMKFAILGLGDTAYDLFCHSAQEWETLLEKAGANKVQDTAKLDVDYEDQAQDWTNGLQESFGHIETIASTTSAPVQASPVHKSIYTKSNPFMGTMITNTTLSGANSSKQVCHFEFEIADPEMAYEAGDALGIIPLNSDALIDAILQAGNWTGEEGISGKDLRTVLSTQEIRNPSKDLISAVAEKSKDASLNALLDDKTAMNDFLYGREVIDFLTDYNVKFKASEFVSLTKPLAHRLYSISSSPNAHKDEVHLTVAAVRYDFNNRKCEGVASCYMADRVKIGQKVAMFMHANKNFSVPNDDTVPMIMVGPGTGIAPFRGFIEERMSRGATGDNWLFFGDRTATDDYLYQDQLEAWENDNKLRISLAWSRQDGIDKTYVQNKMLEQGADLFKALEQGGYFYVCGDASRMAKDVEATLLEIIATFGAMSVDKAIVYLDTLKKEKRYVRDVY